KIYFASDFHLGFPSYEKSLEREKKVVSWLDSIRSNAREIYLLGDIFDYWFEYKKVVPRGFTRFLGKISEITDSGIPVHFFTGNHDIWVFDYLPRETGIILHREPVIKEFNGLKFYLGHGDGLGPGDRNYKLLKKIFTCNILQWLFARLHPNFSVWFAHKWSHSSRFSKVNDPFKGEDKESLTIYAKEMLKTQFFDYFIFGHRHITLNHQLTDKSRFIHPGDWIDNFSYAVFDGEKVDLKFFISK
ncbi:MAG: UDP-2,3-diacylglucosamine diphosphatase, partial [Bacteroidales bacterium]|nr:UDP-2,3-diacylglucosamine diphosphatase [Bacteroidales bacterium]